MEQASLFPDLALPTTRDVARLVRERRRRRHRRDAPCRRRHVPRNPLPIRAQPRPRACRFKWTLNPYRGCTHGCHYCFARRYQAQLELDAGDQFASLIFVKTNFVDRLRAELDRPSWTREQVALGTATDPYQPIEGTLPAHARRRSSACATAGHAGRDRHQGADGACATATCSRT